MTARSPRFVYVWEYSVRPDCAAEFQQMYGPQGPWVKLFRNAPGYVRTELHRDRQVATRYMTFDYWNSFSEWEAYRVLVAAECESLDAQGAALTLEEHEVARLNCVV